MLKLEFELDEKILKELDYDINYISEFLSDGIKSVGLIEEKNENGYFLYRGPGLNTDLAYIGLVADALITPDWFKASCKKFNLLNNSGSKDGSYHFAGNWIESYKKYGRW